MERIPTLSHSSAKNTPEAVAVGVLIFHVSSQGVGVLVDLTAELARSGVRSSHAIEVERTTT